MRPIWFFVGLLLLIVGGIIGITGLVQYISPPSEQPVLAHLHANLWWGGVMVAAGIVFLVTNWRKTAS